MQSTITRWELIYKVFNSLLHKNLFPSSSKWFCPSPTKSYKCFCPSCTQTYKYTGVWRLYKYKTNSLTRMDMIGITQWMLTLGGQKEFVENMDFKALWWSINAIDLSFVVVKCLWSLVYIGLKKIQPLVVVGVHLILIQITQCSKI